MKKLSKKSVYISLVGIGALVVTACGSQPATNTSNSSGGTNSTSGNNSGSGTVSLTVATVNNPDMIQMEHLVSNFEKLNPNIKVNFVTLPENQIRQKITEDVASGAGKFDLVMLGPNDVQGAYTLNHWIVPLNPYINNMSASEKQAYNLQDIIPSIRESLTYKGQLYALPFYGESTVLYYRKDLFAQHHLTMPLHPTWSQVAQFAKQLNDPSKGISGIILRGQAGYGENMGTINNVIHTFGGSWYNMQWQPQFTSQPVKNAITFYMNLLKSYGEPGATGVGFTEGESLMANGKAAMWYDSTVAGGYLWDPSTSKVSNNIGMVYAPYAVTKNGDGWLWTWALGIEAGSKHKADAFKFLEWATSPSYLKLVAQKYGWVNVPPGTRLSLYSNPNYLKAAPFAHTVLSQMEMMSVSHPTNHPVPYLASSWLALPNFDEMGTQIGQIMSAVEAGKESVSQALQQSNQIAAQGAKQLGH
ncbi:sugar ABC transporter substrate-binding protein [Alicyclobacillus tolerans]|uniref:ABC transporter substrate-binding protein n=1 Tax=Alicyclobacillus tolerans TaxID=90970 RepID=UPI001F17999E|nr:sugar ABC transporter substrate-binding protein [Alicyclobacillus tolerans]MCF8568003.1 sugar ABC transporter substrate-binding protein [Alicyclobacillus tolerans]